MKKPIVKVNDKLKHFDSDTQLWTTFGGKYSDGVKELINGWECEWFVDLIFSTQTRKGIKGVGLQVWNLRRLGESSFHIFATDENKDPIYDRVIDYCDFGEDGVELLLVKGVIILPVEF